MKKATEKACNRGSSRENAAKGRKQIKKIIIFRW